MDAEVRERLRGLQAEAQDLLMELADIFPPNYCFTLVARHAKNIMDADIVLTNDDPDDAIAAIDRMKDQMEPDNG